MGSEVARMNEVAGMYGSKHGADGVFFGVRPDDGSVVTEGDLAGRGVRRVQEGMERTESNGCLQGSKRRSPAPISKGAV